MNYIEEDIIVAAGLLAARCYWSGVDHEPVLNQLATDYSRSYGDPDIAGIFNKSFERVIQAMPKVVKGLGSNPEDNTVLASSCATLQTAIQYFDMSGKRRRRLFAGTLFSRSRNPVRDIEASVEAQLLNYSALITSGAISFSVIESLQANS